MFVPFVEDNWQQLSTAEQDNNHLARARRLAFLDGNLEEACDVLAKQANAFATTASPATQREWGEAMMALFSRCTSNGVAARWLATGLLPHPSDSAALATVARMDNVTFQYCMILWSRLFCERLVGGEVMLFVVKSICCDRILASPRCLPHWRLLGRVLAELLPLPTGPSGNCNTMQEEAGVAAAVLERVLRHLDCHIIRYLELRDRPLKAQCGLPQCRSAFDRIPDGVNSCHGSTLSSRDICDAIKKLCLSGGLYMHVASGDCTSVDVDVSVPSNLTGVEPSLEAFFSAYFFHSAPVAFDRLPKADK
ncbi:hypothetical protein ERJ75_001662500 [Trypanosoma vivax]|nr:hypothetical protein ERJ75_001662500 [Trypanosoma vivax]